MHLTILHGNTGIIQPKTRTSINRQYIS